MDYKVKEFCKLISEFALEYKTVRDRLLQQQEKRANHRERHKTRGKLITDTGRFSKTLDSGSNDVSLNDNSYLRTSGAKSGLNNQSSKIDDNNMMEVILKNNGEKESSSKNSHSMSNIPAAAGGLPGVRGRTRQSISGLNSVVNGDTSNRNSLNIHGKMFTTDTEMEDETVDFLVKSTLAAPKGPPPKKRTKKYGDRKSCKLKKNTKFNQFFCLLKFLIKRQKNEILKF